MNTMTKVQKDFINTVILPRLVEMAINDELDSDMTLLSYHDFEVATEKYNGTPDTVAKRQKQIDTLGHYISDDDVEAALERLEREDPCSTDMCDVVQMTEACESMGYITIDRFWKDYM